MVGNISEHTQGHHRNFAIPGHFTRARCQILRQNLIPIRKNPRKKTFFQHHFRRDEQAAGGQREPRGGGPAELASLGPNVGKMDFWKEIRQFLWFLP